MRKTMTKFKSTRGITLIALVITIIVLLILAGVAISMLSGENGILNQAAKAKTETEKKSTEEAVKLAAMSALTAGKGKIKGKEALGVLNKELVDAGYSGNPTIEELKAEVVIDGETYTIYENGVVEIGKKTGEEIYNEKYKTQIDNALKYGTLQNNVYSVNSEYSVMNGGTAPTDVEEIALPYGTTTVSGFTGWYSLKSVVFPDTLTTIESSTFAGCEGLTEISLPNSIKNINGHAFAQCSGITKIDIPNGVTSIGGNAFEGTNITELIVPNTVTSFDLNCSIPSLKRLVLPGIDLKDNFYGGDMFESNLETLVFTEGTKVIGQSAFSNNTKLTTIVLPSTVTNIGSGAFSGCASLSNVYVESENFTSASDIGYVAFAGLPSGSQIFVRSQAIGNCFAALDTTNYTGCIMPEYTTVSTTYDWVAPSL